MNITKLSASLALLGLSMGAAPAANVNWTAGDGAWEIRLSGYRETFSPILKLF